MNKGDKVQLKDRYVGGHYVEPTRFIVGIIDSDKFEFNERASYMVKVYKNTRWHEFADNLKPVTCQIGNCEYYNKETNHCKVYGGYFSKNPDYEYICNFFNTILNKA